MGCANIRILYDSNKQGSDLQGSNVVPLTVESASGTMPTYLGQDTADVQSQVKSYIVTMVYYVFPI